MMRGVRRVANTFAVAVAFACGRPATPSWPESSAGLAGPSASTLSAGDLVAPANSTLSAGSTPSAEAVEARIEGDVISINEGPIAYEELAEAMS
ncbi:MAG: hypothetical protein SFV15_04720 [Polyangiaceae bacterium]|nr:hypothetical protein [Polyangiaceae bacterium]